MKNYVKFTGLILVLIGILSLTGCAANGRKSLERGKDFMKKKDYSRALLEFRNAYRHFPKDADVIYQVGTAYIASGDILNGVRYLRLATQLNPNHVEAQMKLSELMALNSNNDIVQEAERRAKQALAASTGNADAVATLAFAELRLGKIETAEKRLQEVIDRSPQALKAAVILANVRMTKNDVAGAEAILKKTAEANPKTWEAWFSLARFYLLTKRVPEAEAATRKVIEIDPSNEMSLQDLAAMQVSLGRKEDAAETYRKLAAHPSKKFLSSHAVFMFQEGKRAEAVQELEQLYKSNSKNRTLRTQLVAGYIALNKRDVAEKVLNEALSANPKDVDALLQRGQIHLLAGKLDGLEADINEVLKFKNDSGEAHYLMARLHRARQNTKNEERELYEALKLAPHLLAARVDMAQRLIASGGGKAALDLLEATPADQKNLLPVVIQRNWALWATGDVEKARAGIQAGYQAGRSPEILLQDALMQLKDKKYAASRDLMREALKFNPSDMRIIEALAESHLVENGKNVAAAVAEVEQAAKQFPNSSQMQHIRGNWLAVTGRLDDARNAYEEARKLEPNATNPSLAIAQIDMKKGNFDSARQSLDRVLTKNQRDPGANLLVAMIEEKAGQTEKATEAYRKVVEADPRNAIALNNLAYRLIMDTKRADEALKFAQMAKEAAPKNSAVDDTLGWIYYRKGLYTSAVKHLEVATQGSDATPIRLYHLAMAYHQSGNSGKAKATYDRASKMGPLLMENALAKQTLGIQ
jgi:Flp pilus assembly protein TadD